MRNPLALHIGGKPSTTKRNWHCLTDKPRTCARQLLPNCMLWLDSGKQCLPNSIDYIPFAIANHCLSPSTRKLVLSSGEGTLTTLPAEQHQHPSSLHRLLQATMGVWRSACSCTPVHANVVRFARNLCAPPWRDFDASLLLLRGCNSSR
jgi:hypothetical protein